MDLQQDKHPRKNEQPSDSLELIEYMLKELKESPIFSVTTNEEIRKKIEPAVTSIVETLKDKTVAPSATHRMPFSKTVLIEEDLLSPDFVSIERHVECFLLHSWLARQNLAFVFIKYLESLKTLNIKIEDDPSGYIAANLMVLSDMFQKLTDSQAKATDELHSTIGAVIANGAYPPSTRTKIQALGSLYLFRHHTKCVGCLNNKGRGNGNVAGVVVGKSLLQGVPLCYECMKIEEDSMLGKKTYMGEDVLEDEEE